MVKLGDKQQEVLDKILNATNKHATMILRVQETTAANVTRQVAQVGQTLLADNHRLQSDAVQKARDLEQRILADATKTRIDIIRKGSENCTAIIKKMASAESSIIGNSLQSESRIGLKLEHNQERTKLDTINERIMDSLYFPDLSQRQDMIETRVSDFGDSFKWIFDTIGNAPHNFVDWLVKGNGIF